VKKPAGAAQRGRAFSVPNRAAPAAPGKFPANLLRNARKSGGDANLATGNIAMQVHHLMSRDVATVTPGTTLKDAARRMAALDVGVLPVSDKDRLVGIVTDRNIAVRGVAEGKTPNAQVRDVMTPDVKYCFDDQELDEIAANMADLQLRRLPVVDRDKRLAGIVSLADIAVGDDTDCAIEALSGISRSNSSPAVFPVL